MLCVSILFILNSHIFRLLLLRSSHRFLLIPDIHAELLSLTGTSVLVSSILLVAQGNDVSLWGISYLLIFSWAEVIGDQSHIMGGCGLKLIRFDLLIPVSSSDMDSSWSWWCLLLLHSSYSWRESSNIGLLGRLHSCLLGCVLLSRCKSELLLLLGSHWWLSVWPWLIVVERRCCHWLHVQPHCLRLLKNTTKRIN